MVSSARTITWAATSQNCWINQRRGVELASYYGRKLEVTLSMEFSVFFILVSSVRVAASVVGFETFTMKSIFGPSRMWKCTIRTRFGGKCLFQKFGKHHKCQCRWFKEETYFVLRTKSWNSHGKSNLLEKTVTIRWQHLHLSPTKQLSTNNALHEILS